MPKFRNKTSDPLSVDSPHGPRVGAGQVHDIEGEMVGEIEDAYLVRVGQQIGGYGDPDDDGNAEPVYEPELRAVPKSTWEYTGQPIPPLPAKSANKPEWVAYAVAHGVSAEDAETMTKEALVARFDPEPPSSGDGSES